ncbi:MAG TPA: HNH endonuclease, partial [Anaeromyxobacteraceae bacterium]|nr:HNH endonuclease [Anaeromyxobacteraceae bacterium]
MSIAHELNDQLATLARDERRCLAAFLVALADFDRLKLWRELGYPSLFVYLRTKHRYSAGAAQNRKTAAELIQQMPQVGTRLESGDLC